MNLDQLNKWLTLVANLGVMGGLVLVAMQMNFNTATIRLQNDLGRSEAKQPLPDGSTLTPPPSLPRT